MPFKHCLVTGACPRAGINVVVVVVVAAMVVVAMVIVVAMVTFMV